ncbi:glycosyltransferase [Rummeliibacillus stabekisii]|uniref:glycosyltransferase n=1 Tax=Rummeliibacillus stabekisii TaxID=241244 RepID=UPI002040CEBC|nr:glycosyltransferase [Rummeliibacillus stabekisii]MCM3316959.1 glycosyltransferase [Rummeliibacillus stabekisii]
MLKQKILFISEHGDPLVPLGSKQAGGQNNYVKQLALALEEKDYEVDVITHWSNAQSPQIEHFGKNNRVIRIAAGHIGAIEKEKIFDLLPAFYKEMLQLIHIEEYSLVHTHYWMSGILGSMLKNEFSIPWVHTNHSLGIAKKNGIGEASQIRLQMENKVLTEADEIIATTQNEKELIESTVPSPAPIKVVSIGVSARYIETPLNLHQDPYYLYVGRLEKPKGIYVLLEAFKLLLQNHQVPDDIKLFVIGGSKNAIDHMTNDPKNKDLREAIKGFEDRILFLGPKTEKELADYYRNAIATIVPSFYESFGMVAAEAQACGCPVIASKVGGLQDVVLARRTGLHVARGDAEKFAEAMNILLNNEALNKVLGYNAKTNAEKQFDWCEIAGQISTIYKELQHECIQK